MRFIFFILCCYGMLVLAGVVDAGEKQANDVEIVIGGSSYASTHAYKREKIKAILVRELSSNILSEFTNEEILEIIKEVRRAPRKRRVLSEDGTLLKQIEADIPETDLPFAGDEQGRQSSEIEQMLEKYQSEHRGADPLVIDPNKVKDIFIKTNRNVESNDEQ